MLNVWEEQYDLNPMDPGDAAKDPDGDTFSNLEEHDGRGSQLGPQKDLTAQQLPRAQIEVQKSKLFIFPPAMAKFLLRNCITSTWVSATSR